MTSITAVKTQILITSIVTKKKPGDGLTRRPHLFPVVESSLNVMVHGDARERKWRGNWRMEWLASTLRTTSEHGVSRITTTDAHTSAASSRLNWRPSRVKWTRPFRRKKKSGFCACAITFQSQSTPNTNSTTAGENNTIQNTEIFSDRLQA